MEVLILQFPPDGPLWVVVALFLCRRSQPCCGPLLWLELLWVPVTADPLSLRPAGLRASLYSASLVISFDPVHTFANRPFIKLSSLSVPSVSCWNPD